LWLLDRGALDYFARRTLDELTREQQDQVAETVERDYECLERDAWRER
jgi:hypothetical protein